MAHGLIVVIAINNFLLKYHSSKIFITFQIILISPWLGLSTYLVNLESKHLNILEMLW